jgi:hypothetical protein
MPLPVAAGATAAEFCWPNPVLGTFVPVEAKMPPLLPAPPPKADAAPPVAPNPVEVGDLAMLNGDGTELAAVPKGDGTDEAPAAPPKGDGTAVPEPAVVADNPAVGFPNRVDAPPEPNPVEPNTLPVDPPGAAPAAGDEPKIDAPPNDVAGAAEGVTPYFFSSFATSCCSCPLYFSISAGISDSLLGLCCE